MKLKQLETFLWVATLGSFRKVAERLNTTQPTISHRIASLELTLGESLFERGTRNVALTAFGQSMIPYAEKVVSAADQLRDRAKKAARSQGTLRLGVSETIVHTWLPDFLREIHTRHPEMDVDLTVDVTANLRDELVNRTMDLAFLLGPVSAHEIENVTLCHYPLAWVASNDLGFGDEIVTVEQLARHRILTFSANTRPFAEIRARLRQSEGLPARISPSASLAAVKRLACDGIGIAILPPASIEEEVKKGQLQLLRADWRPSDLLFTASYPSMPYRPFLEHLANLAADIAGRNVG